VGRCLWSTEEAQVLPDGEVEDGGDWLVQDEWS
jgi:hypothetical protein